TKLGHKDKFQRLAGKVMPICNTNVIASDVNEQDSWVVNLSNRSFTYFENSILKLNPKFQVVPRFVKKEQIVANIESKLRFLVNDQAELANIRVNLVKILKSCKTLKPNLSSEHLKAIRKLKSYQDVVFTNSDKGNKTVILNRHDYLDKINKIL